MVYNYEANSINPAHPKALNTFLHRVVYVRMCRNRLSYILGLKARLAMFPITLLMLRGKINECVEEQF